MRLAYSTDQQLSRSTLLAAKSAALQNSPPGFWDISSSKVAQKMFLIQPATVSRSSEPNQLRDKGISAQDERKIIALKDFIVKQAHAARA
jgi:phosphoinositide-3-kinase regulatory subunit 4